MTLFILLSSLVLLILLFIQDLKSRSVSVWIFPILILLFIAHSWSAVSVEEMSLNLLFITFTILVLLLYVRITKGTYQLTTYLGLGDILFWGCLCVLMSPLNYLLFFTGSLVLTILVVLVYILFTKKQSVSIPLAGIQAFLLALCMLSALWFPQADIRQTWLNLL